MPGYTTAMNIEISLPDTINQAVDDLAARLKVTRNVLYVMALDKHLRENQETEVTKRIDDFIDRHGQPVDPVFLS